MNFTPSDLAALAALISEAKQRYGKASMERIEETFAVVAGLRPRCEPEDPYQRGSEVIFPGLTAKAWHNPEDFEIIAQLEEGWEIIKQEMLAVLERKMGFQQFVRFDLDDPRSEVPFEWKALYLKDGPTLFPENRALCPETIRIISKSSRIGDIVVFSALNPGGHITPHNATFNYQLNIHMGLSVPEGDCAIRVGGEVRKWEPGKCLIFDSSFEHEAWNRADSTRFIFFTNFWHPELTDPEVDVLTRAYEIVSKEEADRHNYAVMYEKERLVGQKWWK